MIPLRTHRIPSSVFLAAAAELSREVAGPTGMDAADAIAELTNAPTMGVVKKMSYTHTDLIDFIIANPGVSQGALAARYGYTQSWISNVMASDAWKSAMAARREELVDPTLVMSINERFAALTEKSLEVVMTKLSAPQVSDNVALRALELGAKALGVGGNAAPPAPPSDHLAQLAARLIDLQSTVRKGVTYENAPSDSLVQAG